MSDKQNNYKGLFGIITRFPGTILGVFLVLSVASILLTKAEMEFLTGRDDLMPKNTAFHHDYQIGRAHV